MCFTFLAARGHSVGASIVQEDEVDAVAALLSGPHGDRIVLPTDVVAGAEFDEHTEPTVVPADAIPEGLMGLDIGPEAAETFGDVVREAESVFWNGPMGVFEWEAFRAGTEAVARALADVDGFTAVGGGDSAAALRMLGMEAAVTHLSTGGGAGLELLEGRELPGVAVLERWA
jgi:phosphoglycerate kinase